MLMAVDIKVLKDIHRKERMSPYLQSIGKDFYSKVSAYLIDVDAKIENASGNTSKLAVLLGERETIKNTVMDIYEIRERKLVNNAIYYVKSGEALELDNLTAEEEDMLKHVFDIVAEHRKDVMASVQGDGDVIKKVKTSAPRDTTLKEKEIEAPQKKTDSMDYVTLRILEDLAPISGIDGKTYGAFKKEDVVTIPKKNASGLISQGVAEEIHTA